MPNSRPMFPSGFLWVLVFFLKEGVGRYEYDGKFSY